ncbi:LOW QUALITY PROTEIN: arrestin domain-containing protein 17-like [Portunus trituberculatus]|uniref:LOW QUALITY PROTEIN: arrestin domain-containing protein 17-like n=1 Tax=Portunus trituberculatus TaxID=210409 RepID=UPI001E1D18F7|nr:LOW QUALITY PROTEIN: arrestin domain-containing protein 17-like [Portunus trituberculatus]
MPGAASIASNMKMKARWREAVRKLQLTDWDTPMLRPKKFEIRFDAPGAVYFSTQTITGSVLLEVTEPINLKGVKMRFRGECCIHFSDYPTQLQKLKKGGKSAGKRLLNSTSSTSTTSTNTWLSQQNGHARGIVNPGYIPDNPGSDDEQNVGGGNSGGSSRSYSSDRRRGECGRMTPLSRPRSTEGAWLEGSFKGPRQHYRAQETYFDCEFYIYGHKYQKDEKELLPAGEHEFPFAFNLPPNLPPSFHSDKGFITYTAIAILDRPAAANLVQKAGFSLHSILDLNMYSQASSSCSRSKSKNLCCFCCQTGPITLAARIPRRGYVPGEKIYVTAEVDNISSRNTRKTRLLLLQVITYIMPNGVKEVVEERVVKEVVRGMIPPGESDMWEAVALTVPPLVPANVHLTCRLLDVQYRIDMILEPPLPSADLKVSMPLTIGSVPLRNRFTTFLPPGETRRASGLPGINYSNFPFYWFGECFFGSEALERQYERITGMTEDYGPQFSPITPFAPKYICYTPGNNVDENVR